jgi:hypothetical protein
VAPGFFWFYSETMVVSVPLIIAEKLPLSLCKKTQYLKFLRSDLTPFIVLFCFSSLMSCVVFGISLLCCG